MENHFENFIESTVSKGGFSNASEEARPGLRLLEEEESRIIILQNAIREGIESGRAVDFDPKKHLETLKSGKKIMANDLKNKTMKHLYQIDAFTDKILVEIQLVLALHLLANLI